LAIDFFQASEPIIANLSNINNLIKIDTVVLDPFCLTGLGTGELDQWSFQLEKGASLRAKITLQLGIPD